MDQIANMLNMIKNANRVEHETVIISYSKLRLAIADCLLKQGYIKSVNKKTQNGFPVLELGLVYIDGMPKVKGVERVSKSSCRVYKGAKDIRSFRNGYGIMVLTTPKGILTNKEARKEMVGGEVLFKMW
jgi:small subunit ribosomal protein S8